MSNLLKYVVTAFAVGAIISPNLVMAEETKTEGVIVSATRVERELMDVPMSVSVVTAEDIKRNPSTSIAELLRDIPGVTITNNTGLKRIEIRGEDTFRTLVLIDGQKLSEQKSMDGTLILVDPASVERVEVIKGPASVLYGSDAIGGVINIITKKNPDKVIQGTASFGYYGENDGLTESLSLYGAKNGWNYSLLASNADFNDTKTVFGTKPNSESANTDFRGSLSYDFNEKISAGVSASYYTSENHGTGEEVVDDNYIDPTTFTDVNSWDMKKASAFFEAKNINDFLARVRIDAWYQETYKNFVNDFNFTSMSYHFIGEVENTLDTLGASIQTDWLLGDNHYLIAGYEFYRDSLDANDRYNATGFAPFPPTPGPTSGADTVKSDSSQTNHAFYLAMESTLPADFILTYGMRYTFVQTDLDSFNRVGTRLPVPGFTPVPSGKSYSDSENNSRPVFNVGLVWEGIENLALRASWSQGFRVPLLTEKFVDSGMMGVTIYGNPDLKPETSDNFEIGARYNYKGFTSDLAAFYSVADDYINTVDISSSEMTRENIAKAKTYGLEAVLRYDFENGFSPYVNATLMRREFDDGDAKTYDTGTPLLQGRAGVMYYKSGLYNDVLDINVNAYVSGQTGCEEGDTHYDGFATLNLGFGADMGKEKNWNVQVELLNLLNKRYYLNDDGYESSPEAGIHANVKLSYTF